MKNMKESLFRFSFEEQPTITEGIVVGCIFLYLFLYNPLLLFLLLIIYELQYNYLSISLFIMNPFFRQLIYGLLVSSFFSILILYFHFNLTILFFTGLILCIIYLYYLISLKPLIFISHYDEEKQLNARKIVQLNRYNAPYPNGYYVVELNLHHKLISPGSVHSVNMLGEEFVLFRTKTSSNSVVKDRDDCIALLDAYCPHLGANLSVGGKVIGENLECPFHGWKFNIQGKCVDVPYIKATNNNNCNPDKANCNSSLSGTKKIPEIAKTASFPLIHQNNTQLILVYYDIDKKESTEKDRDLLKPIEEKSLILTGYSSRDITGNQEQILIQFLSIFKNSRSIAVNGNNFQFQCDIELNSSNYSSIVNIIGCSLATISMETAVCKLYFVVAFTPQTAYFVRIKTIVYIHQTNQTKGSKLYDWSLYRPFYAKLFLYYFDSKVCEAMNELDYSINLNKKSATTNSTEEECKENIPETVKQRKNSSEKKDERDSLLDEFREFYSQFYSILGTRTRTGLDW